MGKPFIRLLGRLRVSYRAGTEIPVSGRKQQALLAYLALNADRPQPRDRLAALLWGERFDDQARQSLRQSISKLKKALPDSDKPVLTLEGDHVTLDAGAIHIDVDDLETLAADGTPEALARAAGLCGETLLDGLDAKEAGFDEWAGAERARIHDLTCGVLARLAAHQEKTGETAFAIETAKRLVAFEPLREDAHRALMRLYAGAGQRAQALKQFQLCTQILERELNAEPETETRRLYEKIQAEPSPLPAAGLKAAPSGAAEAVSPLSDTPSIAVLPFANLSDDPEQEYFSDGIADDLITALSNVRSFFVIDRSSSFTYKGRAVDVKEVGRTLGVRYVLEGSVRKAGRKVRVAAQLIDAATGSHVWADRYDGALDDIFDLQDQIAASVVGAIEPQLHRAEVERIRHKRPESFDAYDLTLSGLAKMNELTPKGTAEALELFLKAIEIDPNYARAYVCASYCHRRQVQIRGMVLADEDKADSMRLAQAGLKADRTDPYVLWQGGMTIGLVGGDFNEAAALIDRSLSINANANRGWIASGSIRCFLGEPETAIEAAERAMRLSPLDVSMWVAYGVLANAHMQLENYEDAAAWARKSIHIHRDNLPAYHVLAASLAQLERADEAAVVVRDLLDLDPGLTIAGLRARYQVAGRRNLKGFLDGLKKAGLPE